MRHISASPPTALENFSVAISGSADVDPLNSPVSHVGVPARTGGNWTRKLGRSIWKKWSGYHRRSLVETQMGCFKRLGERVMARDFQRQVTELQVRASILNRFTSLGTPETVRVA